MSADIVERLELLAKVYGGTTLTEAAAEIGRLRGGWEEMTRTARQMQMSYVDNHQGDVYHAMQALVVKKGLDPSGPMFQPIASIAPAEAKDPVPAMPNGLEADMSAQLDAMTAAYERMTAYTIVHKGQLVYMSDLGRAAYSDVVAERDAALRAADNRDAAGVDTLVAKDVQRVMASGDGFWAPCSGCYETEDGHPVGEYPYSSIFQCALGGGCRECGGLGAVWDSTDYAAMAEAVLSAEDTPAAVPAGVAVAKNKWAPPYPDAAKDPFNALLTTPPAAQKSRCQRGLADDCCCNPEACEPAAQVQAAPQEGERRWPFVESPGEFAERLRVALTQFPLIGAVRNVLIENPPALAAHPSACELGADSGIDYDEHPFACPFYRGKPCECGQDQHIRFADKGRQDAAIAAALTAALQHRGDSRGGEG